MRIITGTLKGRRLSLPNKELDIRPTSDRTKEGMFGVISARRELEGIRVLDLFAGTGNLGFEALSRGAKSIEFVDGSRYAITLIQKNADQFGVSSQVHCILSDVQRFIQGTPRSYDLVFADPPYDYPEMPELVDRIINGGWLSDNGWFVLEHDRRHDFTDHSHCAFSKPYGRTVVTIFLSFQVFDPDTEEMEDSL
jgi:16S rRNA (guanine(966)-N(2))-methyltransferase RsmD